MGKLYCPFPTGTIVATPGALAALTPTQMIALLARHVAGDWGEMDAEDCATNDRALDPREPQRLMSAYTVDGERIWVITEWNRSVTTLLLPSEY